MNLTQAREFQQKYWNEYIAAVKEGIAYEIDKAEKQYEAARNKVNKMEKRNVS